MGKGGPFYAIPRLYLDRRYQSLKPAASRLLVDAHMHAEESELDGVVTLKDFAALAALAGIQPRQVEPLVAQIVDAGLLEPAAACYRLVDFRGKTHEEREATRASWRARQGRRRVTPDVTPKSRRDTDRDNSHVTPHVTPAPRVVPSPSPSETPPTSESPPKPPKPGGSVSVVSGTFASEYDGFVAELSQATGRRFRGDAVSRKLYVARRHDGRTPAELLAAARGVALSRHHMGLNDASMPYNAPANVLRSKVLDQLIALGSGEIGLLRAETAEERQEREWAAARERHAQRPGLQA